jgi:hypothetical protein
MQFSVPLKISPEAVGHLGVNKIKCPFGELEEREQVDRDG